MIESAVVDVIIRERRCTADDINMETRLSELGIDSLQAITILYELEEHFGIEVPNELMEHLDTVGDIISTIRKVQQEQ